MDYKDTDKAIRKINAFLSFLTTRHMHPFGKPVPGVFNQGIILQDRWPDLFNELVEITNCTATEDVKQEQRYLAFAATYKKPGDLEYGKVALNSTFDEQLYLDFINRNTNFNNHLLITEIEAEFWRNYSLVNDIGLLCNIYREQWRGHLPEIDVDYFSWGNCLYSSTNTHELYLNVKALRDCGLLKAKDVEFEVNFSGLACKMNSIVDDVVEFFMKMRRSTIATKDLDQTQSTKILPFEKEPVFEEQKLSGEAKLRAKNKVIIEQSLSDIDSLGWKKAFSNEEDYKNFVLLLVNFFAGSKYDIPAQIKTIRGCRTKLAPALNKIHKELSDKQLKGDDEFMAIIRTLSCLSDKAEADLYKIISR